MILRFIEQAARLIMEWAMRKRYNQRHIVDEVAEGFNYYAPKPLRSKISIIEMRTRAVKKALL